MKSVLINDVCTSLNFETKKSCERYQKLDLIKAILENNNLMIVIRDRNGIVVYENELHKNFVLTALKAKKIEMISHYLENSINEDVELLRTKEYYSILTESIFGKEFLLIRNKIHINDDFLIMTTICDIGIGAVSQRDYLTNCLMRDSLSKIERSGRYTNKILAYIDLDGFKNINDFYGHKVGDECLKIFSTIIQKSIRDTSLEDTFVRLGGDEFAIFFDCNDLQLIKRRLEEMNSLVKNYFLEKDLNLSFSYGVVKIHKNNIIASLDEADILMYKSKKKKFYS